jgi:hypothetical protein
MGSGLSQKNFDLNLNRSYRIKKLKNNNDPI